MSIPLNPPNERAVLAKDDDYVEFVWNPSEHGVKVTAGVLMKAAMWITWDKLGALVLKRQDARAHWRDFKRLGYHRLLSPAN